MAKLGGKLVDVRGSFRSFIKNSPRVLNKHVRQAIQKASSAAADRMKANARIGPDAPHIKDDIEIVITKGLSGKVGYLHPKPAGGSDPNATQPEVALYQEYGTKQARGNQFMSRAAEGSQREFQAFLRSAIKDFERAMTVGDMDPPSGGGGGGGGPKRDPVTGRFVK
jgi:hypothetical protein